MGSNAAFKISDAVNSHGHASNFRTRCSVIRTYPLYRIHIHSNLVHLFSEGSPCHRLAVNIQNYEHFLFTSTTQASSAIRYLLGDPWSTITTLTQKLAAIYSRQVSALLTAYRLLDLELLHNGSNHPVTLPPSYPNSISPRMVEKATIKDRWKKLENWQELLVEFRDCYNGVFLGEEDLVSIDDSPFVGSLAHLQGLAESHSNQRFTSAVQNFRGAALHWTFLHETTHLNTQILPVMPETLSSIVNQHTLRQLNEWYQPRTREKMDNYLRKHSQGELVLPLHLALMLTPCFLLMLTNLVKSNFPRQAIYQLSCALGNQKPDILIRVEREIWNAFSKIREDSSMAVIHNAFRQFLDSNSVMEAINMSPMDPAFSFFRSKWLYNILQRQRNDIKVCNLSAAPSQLADHASSAISSQLVVYQPSLYNIQTTVETQKVAQQGVVDVDGDGDGGDEPQKKQNKEKIEAEARQHADGEVDGDVDEEKSDEDGGGGDKAQNTEDRDKVVELSPQHKDSDEHAHNDNRDDDGSGIAEKEVDHDIHMKDPPDNGKNKEKLISPERVVEKRKRQEIDYIEKQVRRKRRKSKKNGVGDSEEDEKEQGLRWVRLEDDIFVETPSLNIDLSATKPKLHMKRTVRAWGPQGETLEFEPSCHDHETLEALQSLFARIEEGYEEGQPLYIKENRQTTLTKESVFKVISEAEFAEMEQSDIQEILREQHIVVTGKQHRKQTFEEALLDIAPLDWVTGIQDLSIPDGPERTRIGTVADILKATQSANSKILNGLSFQDPWAGIKRSSFSSDAHALATVYKQEGAMKRAASIEHLRWSLAATKDAFHVWHIDSDGYGTFVNVITGSKWWIVARPRSFNVDVLNTTSVFLDEAIIENLDVEAILLQPGSELIMRPNTLHAVYTPEHAVCRGGHFYATSTMQDTFSALVHTFMCDLVITNATNPESRLIITEMINFYHTALVKQAMINGSAKPHVPDVTKEKCFMDILVVCSLGVLLNVLCQQTYSAPGLERLWTMDDAQVNLWDQYDVNGLSEDDRKLLCLARGRSIELISWLSMTYATGIPDMPVQDLFSIVLVNICKMLCDYKWQADESKSLCSPDFTIERLKIQIHAVLASVIPRMDLSRATLEQLDWNAKQWKLPMANSTSKTILPHVTGMNIHKSSAPSYKRKSQSELFKLGETALDQKFAGRLEVKQEIIDIDAPTTKRN